ncbi:carbonate dehydratase, eukaryotic-type, partial [Oesophagostomum dentatum]
SPVDIRASYVDHAPLREVNFAHYDFSGPVNIQNNGHTITVDGFDQWKENQPYISIPEQADSYRLVQFHFHWAQKDHLGSEHTLGGLHYAAEIHFVHNRWDVTSDEAAETPDGVAVIAVFALIGDNATAIEAISASVGEIVYPGNSTTIPSFNAGSLLPSNTGAFYRYKGSFTTPGCQEVVVWTILEEPIVITQSQLEAFRRVNSPEGVPFEHNARPPQPLNRRRILYRSSCYDNSSLCDGHQSLSLLLTLILMVLICLICH